MKVPRRIGFQACAKSALFGSRLPMALWTTSRDIVLSRLRMISAMPNSPMASTAKSMPSERKFRPKVMRSWPVSRSVPTVESRMPSTIMAMARRIEPRASTTAKTRPMIISEKYSAGPKISASRVSGAPSAAMIRVATDPAKKEPIAAMPSATPARPWRAISWPSRAVTTEVASPGMLTRIAVVEPPYCAP